MSHDGLGCFHTGAHNFHLHTPEYFLYLDYEAYSCYPGEESQVPEDSSTKLVVLTYGSTSFANDCGLLVYVALGSGTQEVWQPLTAVYRPDEEGDAPSLEFLEHLKKVVDGSYDPVVEKHTWAPLLHATVRSWIREYDHWGQPLDHHEL